MQRTNHNSLSAKMSESLDNVIGIFSPKAAYHRAAYRFGYDAIDQTRTRKKRADLGGTADRHLTERNLYKLREICRSMARNNPLVKGLLKIERDGVIGSGVKISARTEDAGWNKAAEQAWQAIMLNQNCDVTNRLNFNKLLRLLYLSYRRDGDAAVIFTDDGLQGIEGEQIGTPSAWSDAKHYDVVNGLAFSKLTKKLVGYFIGQTDRSKYGYISPTNYNRYKAEDVFMMFDPERFSQSRGEPVLTPSVNFIDTLCDYIDAELVAAKVNACFTMFVAKDNTEIPDYTGSISDTGETEKGERLEKVQPGTIVYGQPGEKAEGIGQVRPGALFDPFVNRMLTLIGGPLGMPLMLITLDFTGATYMNARIAYQKVQETWRIQQSDIVKPFVARTWTIFMQKMIDQKELTYRKDAFRHDILCNRWPYVDPFKEAKADEQQLKNGTTTRTEICARQGRDFDDVTKTLMEEQKTRKDLKPIGEKQNAVPK